MTMTTNNDANVWDFDNTPNAPVRLALRFEVDWHVHCEVLEVLSDIDNAELLDWCDLSMLVDIYYRLVCNTLAQWSHRHVSISANVNRCLISIQLCGTTPVEFSEECAKFSARIMVPSFIRDVSQAALAHMAAGLPWDAA